MSVPMHRRSQEPSPSHPPDATSHARFPVKHLVLLGVLSGVLTALSWLPVGAAFLMPLAMVPAMRGLRLVRDSRGAICFGVAFEAALHAVGGYYVLALLHFSWLGPVLFVLDIAYHVPFAVAAAWGGFWIGKRAGVPATFVFVLLYSVMEWLRTIGDLSSCADLMAHAFGGYPQWLAWTSWTGPYAMSLLAYGVGALIEAAIFSWRSSSRAIPAALAAAVLWLGPPATDLFRTFDAAPSEEGSLRVGIVQPSFTPQEKLQKERWPESWNRLARLTREAAGNADLVVWPENSRPGYLFWKESSPFSDPPVEALAREVRVPILYGCVIARVSGNHIAALYNGAAIARPDGTPGDWYAKQQLLPFVEGMPFARWFGWDPAEARRDNSRRTSLLTLMGNLTPGSRPTIFNVGSARIGVLICYEGFYPQLVRRYRLEGANALCVMTNDAWFGRTLFARQHAHLLSARCREAGIPAVRAANSGVSSAMDRSGRMIAASGLFEVSTLDVPLRPATTGPTFYARTGDLVIWAEMAGLALLVLRGLLRGQARGGLSPRTLTCPPAS